tara:strand:- start:2787 stop:3077 length:291 start_codon:yes stop_codon:yes gene_type:complete
MSLENENPQLEEAVEVETPLKEMLVNYVGEKTSPEDDQVTVQMIVNTIAAEFPEFLSVVAEENWVRGYHQALTDVETGQKAYQEYLSNASIKETNE